MMEWATEVERDGYGLVHDVCDADQVGAILSSLENVNIARSRAGIRHVMSQSAVANVARSAQMLTIATSVLGPTAVPFRATLFDKSPESNWLVAWHQDRRCRGRRNEKSKVGDRGRQKKASFTLTLPRKRWSR